MLYAPLHRVQVARSLWMLWNEMPAHNQVDGAEMAAECLNDNTCDSAIVAVAAPARDEPPASITHGNDQHDGKPIRRSLLAFQWCLKLTRYGRHVAYI